MDIEKIINFFFEIATLRRLTRSHRQVIDGASDNISDHSFRVAIIGFILAELEKADKDKVLKMGLFHDLAETRTGDLNFPNKQYVEVKEEEARIDQTEEIPAGKEILEILKEFEDRKTKEANLAKDADLLDQMILQQEYFYKDEKNNRIWQDFTEKDLKTESAKKLAKEIRKSNPLEWIYALAEKKTGYRVSR